MGTKVMEINFNDLLDALLLTVVASLFIATLLSEFILPIYMLLFVIFAFVFTYFSLKWIREDD